MVDDACVEPLEPGREHRDPGLGRELFDEFLVERASRRCQGYHPGGGRPTVRCFEGRRDDIHA